MAVTAYAGKNGCVYINGYNLSDNFQSMEFGRTQEVFEANSFRSTAKRFVDGLPDATITGEGLWDPAAGQMDNVVDDALSIGGNHTIIYLPGGDSFGIAGYGTRGIITDHSISGSTDDAVATSFEAQPTVGRERLLVLNPLSPSLTTTTTTSHIDNGAATASGGAGYLMVTDGTGFGSIDVTIEMDDNSGFASATTLITFTSVTATNAHERIALATDAAVEQYVRAVITFTGVSDANVFVGFHRGAE
jgi:hypothetical protein